MTLLLREVVRLLAETTLWLVAVLAPCVAVALLAARTRRRPAGPALRAAAASGLVAAGLAARFDLPDPTGFTLAARPIALTWVVGAALAAALIVVWRPVRARSAG